MKNLYELLAGMVKITAAKFGLAQDFAFKNNYLIECHAPDGTLKWSEEIPNIVVNVGLNDVLDKYLKGSTYTAAFFVGLTDGTPTFAAADTMASHAGWVEVTDYDEANRQTLTLGTVASQSVDNSASKAVFTINATVTVGGAFVTTNSTKGGTTGILFGGAAFAADRSAVDNDTITITITISAASA